MINLMRNAPWRVLVPIVKFMCMKRNKSGTALPPLTDHIARDIGLTPHETELQSLHWPSRDSRHPFL